MLHAIASNENREGRFASVIFSNFILAPSILNGAGHLARLLRAARRSSIKALEIKCRIECENFDPEPTRHLR